MQFLFEKLWFVWKETGHGIVFAEALLNFNLKGWWHGNSSMCGYQPAHNLVANRLCFLRSAFVSTSECAIDAEKFNAAGNNMGGSHAGGLEFGASQL